MKNKNSAGEKSDIKKQLILDAAERCLKKRGLENLNMREIAKEAKISLGTIGYYFPSKDYMLMSIFRDFVKKVLSGVQYDSPGIAPGQRLDYLLRGIFNELTTNSGNSRMFIDLWSHTMNNREIREILRGYYKNSLDWLVKLFEDGNASGQFNVDNPLALASFIFAVIDGLKVQVHLMDMERELETVKPVFTEYIKKHLTEENKKPSARKDIPDALKQRYPAGVHPLFNLEGKVSIVTGGSGGLGFMMAEGLAEAGASLVLCSRNMEECERASQKISTGGANVIAVRCDVTNPEDVDSLVKKTISHYGNVDILINNAGYGREEHLESLSIEKWGETLDINVKGPYLCARAAGRHMIKRKTGRIINIVSTAGAASAGPDTADSISYSTSEGAIVAFTRDLARKWSRYNINVNAIAPGYFKTDISKYSNKNRNAKLLKEIPMKRLGTDSEIKGVAVFLSSPASNYITGQVIAVDGGAFAWTAGVNFPD